MPPLLRTALVLGLGLAGPALALDPVQAPAAIEQGPRASFQATVLSVGDGDTVRVSREGLRITIRLACIDAPEMAQRPWGEASRAYLRARLPRGSLVTVRPITRDRYGRTVAELISEISLNLVMVEDGQAFAYRRYLGSCDAHEFLDAEYRASRRRYGVWQVPGGITRPWTFRHMHHNHHAAGGAGSRRG